MQAEILQLLERHCQTLRTEIDELAGRLAWVDGESGPDGARLAEDIARVHKIKGSSGSIGFSDVSTAARDLEFALRKVAEKGAGNPSTRQEIRQCLTAFAEKIADTRPEHSRLYALDFSEFDRLP